MRKIWLIVLHAQRHSYVSLFQKNNNLIEENAKLEEQVERLQNKLGEAYVDCSILRSVDPVEIRALIQAHGGSERCATLTPMQVGKAGVQNLNKFMQRKLGFDRPVVCLAHGDGIFDFVSSKGSKFYLNDPILITKNDYKTGICNGDLGTIVKVFDDATEDGRLGLLKIDGRTIDLRAEMLDKMNLGCAMTVHKSQGSQWENVVLVLDRGATRMLDKTLLYTGVTRAQKKLTVCCEDMDLVQKSRGSGLNCLSA